MQLRFAGGGEDSLIGMGNGRSARVSTNDRLQFDRPAATPGISRCRAFAGDFEILNSIPPDGTGIEDTSHTPSGIILQKALLLDAMIRVFPAPFL